MLGFGDLFIRNKCVGGFGWDNYHIKVHVSVLGAGGEKQIIQVYKQTMENVAIS